jgi:hypothetical protein
LQPKLIPIVSTADTREAVTLAQTYLARWPQQENIIRDFLLPLGQDTNHGYAKTPIENSERAKQRTRLEQRRDRLHRWADSARKRYVRACQRADRRYAQRKARGELLYRELNQQQDALAQQDADPSSIRRTIRTCKAAIDAELDGLTARFRQAECAREAEWRKLERYCQQQRDVLRQLADLNRRPPQMYELNHDKDQIMTACKLALANLAMWTRNRYFPASYAQATWQRLAPFFQLPGRIRWEPDYVRVEVHPFNDRALNRDLIDLCAQVERTQPHLPDGRRLLFTVAATPRPILKLQQLVVA